MRYGTTILLAILACAAGCRTGREEDVVAPGKTGGGSAMNLRILTENVPDWSSRENFVRSALSGWETDHEKALAQFRWSYRSRRVGGFAVEDGRPVLDPVLFFNSYGITQCSMISAMNVSLWEAAGWPGRTVSLFEHCVAEAKYGGGWHMFDNDFCNYFINERGEVAGAEDLFRGRERKPGQHYLFDHCPTAASPGGRITMGPSSAKLADVAGSWYSKCRPTEGYSLAHAGHRHILGIRLGERYIRYWKPTGEGPLFSRLLQDKDPATREGSILINSRSNGHWAWKPDLSDARVLHAQDNVMCDAGGLRAKDMSRPARAVFHVASANVTTGARVVSRVEGNVSFSVSGNGGLTWESVDLTPRPDGLCEGVMTNAVAGRLDYLVRAEPEGNSVLKDLELNTITQVNPRTLPALRLGRNRVVVLRDEHLEYQALCPRLTADRIDGEVYRASGWHPVAKPGSKEPSLRATDRAELILRAAAPRDIRHVRMACTAHLVEPSGGLSMDISTDGGKTWRGLAEYGYGEATYDVRPAVEIREIPRGTREVLLRYACRGAGNGLANVLAEAGHEPADAEGTIEVMYRWEECRAGTWVQRSHCERMADRYHEYAIQVGGERPPRMSSVEVGPAGAYREGYSDGVTESPARAAPEVILAYGGRVSKGCRYTVSRPAGAAFPDTGGKLLTDGYVGLASYWGLDNVNLSGKKNDKRVGELAVWDAGEELVVTVDLGRRTTVGGGRVCAVQPNAKVLYPERIGMEVSADGETFRPVGEASWEDCFFPSGDVLPWEGWDSPLYEHLPAGGILDFKFPIVLDSPAEARHVRFRLRPPVDGSAGIGLWEVEVYDRIARSPWSERIVLPKRPPSEKK